MRIVVELSSQLSKVVDELLGLLEHLGSHFREFQLQIATKVLRQTLGILNTRSHDHFGMDLPQIEQQKEANSKRAFENFFPKG